MSSLKKYEYVITVAECGGISQAADKLQIAQPTLSKYLKKLESDLGFELFDRSTIPLKTTQAGELFVEVGMRLINIERELDKRLSELMQNQVSIRVGISPSRSPHMMPLILKEFKRVHSDVSVIIEERTTAELSSRLTSGELDLIISLDGDDTYSFESIPLFEEKILLAAPKCDTPSDLSFEQVLKSTELISVGRGQIMWQAMNDIVKELSLPSPSIECQSIESALALVKKGLGATLVPSYVFNFGDFKGSDCVSFYDLPSELHLKNMSRRVCLFYRKEQSLTESERDFIACVQKISRSNI